MFVEHWTLVFSFIHLKNYEAVDKSSVFHKHIEETHGGKRENLELEAISSCGNDTMLGQATEAVFVKGMNPELNRKVL